MNTNTDFIIHEPAGEYHARSRSGEFMSSHLLADFRDAALDFAEAGLDRLLHICRDCLEFDVRLLHFCRAKRRAVVGGLVSKTAPMSRRRTQRGFEASDIAADVPVKL